VDRVLLVHDGAATRVGTPLVADAAVELEVLGHGRGPKIRIGKYKRRKDYRRRGGHRQNFTEVKVKTIRG
jgi:large subunit ribosomal protein L21